MPKVKCPRHNDDHPSVETYNDHGWCYAGCGYIPLYELGIENEESPKQRFRDNLELRHSHISTLPMGNFRGFTFPYDETGFYILFPGTFYFKHRNFDPEAKPKYKNPIGHPQPLFKVRVVSSPLLFLVEGELNALSIGSAITDCDVISPGSAGDFSSKKSLLSFTTLPHYDKIFIIVDRDAAGARAAIEAKTALRNKAREVKILFMEIDANQIHNEKGLQELKQTVLEKMHKAL